MASVLYKRYIPPKVPSSSAEKLTVQQESESKSVENGSKRKRDEAEQTKASKREKRIKGESKELSQSEVSDGGVALVGTEADKLQATGNFSHIKSAKKRHKLEKEARKQKKAASRSEKDHGIPVVETTIAEKAPSPANKIQEYLDREDEENSSGDENEHLKRHTGVMSKFQKALNQPKDTQEDSTAQSLDKPEPQLRDLRPLPQPEPKAPAPFKPDPSSVPSWLARPDRFSSTPSTNDFGTLGLEPQLVRHLNALSFVNPLPVQEAIVPLLMPTTSHNGIQPSAASRFGPGSEPVLPDVAVSAPTGSGKTLAYLLPIIESLKQTSPLRRLRAAVVVPTRDLVQQVRAVAEALAKGSQIQIGAAVNDGRTKFADEQSKLVTKGMVWDPQQYKNMMQKQHLREYPPVDLLTCNDGDGASLDLELYLPLTPKEEQRVVDMLNLPPDFVATYAPSVDLLIATPGRLLEHINNTLGFDLSNLDWLVLDEADKLLEQQYDGFLETVNSLLPSGSVTTRGCRKVVLSATMTRDVSKLSALKLRWPRLVVVGDEGEQAVGGNDEEIELDLEGRYCLPSTLKEYCIPIEDASEKPLLLLKLLESHISDLRITDNGKRDVKPSVRNVRDLDSQSSESEASNSSSSLSSSSTSSESTGISSDDSSSESEIEASAANSDFSALQTIHASTRIGSTTTPGPTLLIFTSDTTSAARLAHLLCALRPSLASSIIPIIKNQRPSNQHFPMESPVIAITTDRASRGLDSVFSRPVTHVIQYDVPRSLRDYVHRAGRSARAGRIGESWSFYQSHQGRWFVKEVLRSDKVKRNNEVEKIKVAIGNTKKEEETRTKFVEVVNSMRKLVFRTGKD